MKKTKTKKQKKGNVEAKIITPTKMKLSKDKTDINARSYILYKQSRVDR